MTMSSAFEARVVHDPQRRRDGNARSAARVLKALRRAARSISMSSTSRGSPPRSAASQVTGASWPRHWTAPYKVKREE
jgi:hypothetical protein